jgi:cell division protein FtsN
MTEQPSEPGLEVVLDNRKLIIAFAVLIAICGCFFVVGFIEGKRQGYQEGAQVAAESGRDATAGGIQAQTAPPPDTGSAAAPSKEGANVQPLDWYKNVNRPEGETESAARILPPPASKKTAPAQTADAGVKAKPEPMPKTGEPVTYSVQAGAFRQKSEAEVKLRALRAKGFDSRIDAPESPGELYLIKVGKFKSRADAVAMQLRLKKSGFNSFIKTD